MVFTRAIGSVGRAFPSHGKGQRFESSIAHQVEILFMLVRVNIFFSALGFVFSFILSEYLQIPFTQREWVVISNKKNIFFYKI